MAETCRDVLADMLATASNISDFDDTLDSHGYPPDRIRAAIAADDAERERVRAERPTTLEDLAAGHPAAERQLRALRAVAQVFEENADHVAARCRCTGCRLLAELDAADAAARGDV